MLMIISSIVVIIIVGCKMYIKYFCGMCTCPDKLTNKVVIVTGSNTGIGYETAKDMARRGAKVILACRDTQKGIVARDNIINATKNTAVIFKQMDLASFRSIRAFADDILKTETNLHILINNAGTGKLDNTLTENNLPIEAQINHFGPFLLTVLLLPLLKSSAPSRIINVSSTLHKFGTIDINTFSQQAKTSLEHRRVYSNTKLANVLFTKKLSEDLRGTGVIANCLHPGAVSTDIFRNQYSLIRVLINLIFKTPLEGAQTSIHLAVSPKLECVTGKYFANCKEAKTSKKGQDKELAEQLWILSEKVTSDEKNVIEQKDL